MFMLHLVAAFIHGQIEIGCLPRVYRRSGAISLGRSFYPSAGSMVTMPSATHPAIITLVIPAHNEAPLLPRLLDTVDEARRRYLEGAGGGRGRGGGQRLHRRHRRHRPRPRAAEWCGWTNGASARPATVAPRWRTGSILAFVDADIRIHPETFNAIEEAMSTGRFVAGATGVSMERWSLGIAATYALMVPWVWMLRMDTGVVFCGRDDFEAIGGYDESLLSGKMCNCWSI